MIQANIHQSRKQGKSAICQGKGFWGLYLMFKNDLLFIQIKSLKFLI